MVELPALKAHAERLDREFAGAMLEGFSAHPSRVLKTARPAPDAAFRHPVAYIGSRGLFLVIDFGVASFVVDVPDGGALRGGQEGELDPDLAGGCATWRFADGSVCVLSAGGAGLPGGVWVVAGDPESQEPLRSLGPDANEVALRQLVALLRANPMPLHGFLRDQHLVAGLGRRLAAEICHRARLSPLALTDDLTTAEAERLAEAVQTCVNEALAEERGSPDLDTRRDRPGHVHGRVGEACERCGDTIRALDSDGGGLAFCPSCQSEGRSSAAS